jgi:hypothetical protein
MAGDTLAILGSIGGFPLSHTESLDVTETFPLKVSIPGGSEMVIPLTGLTNPKLLVVLGDEGISVTPDNGYGVSHFADPLFVTMNVKDGLGITEVTIANSDDHEHLVIIVAAE